MCRENFASDAAQLWVETQWYNTPILFVLQPLSDKSHYDKDHESHNVEYDHDAFLGEEEAERFDKLSPTEAKEQLGLIDCIQNYNETDSYLVLAGINFVH